MHTSTRRLSIIIICHRRCLRVCYAYERETVKAPAPIVTGLFIRDVVPPQYYFVATPAPCVIISAYRGYKDIDYATSAFMRYSSRAKAYGAATLIESRSMLMPLAIRLAPPPPACHILFCLVTTTVTSRHKACHTISQSPPPGPAQRCLGMNHHHCQSRTYWPGHGCLPGPGGGVGWAGRWGRWVLLNALGLLGSRGWGGAIGRQGSAGVRGGQSPPLSPSCLPLTAHRHPPLPGGGGGMSEGLGFTPIHHQHSLPISPVTGHHPLVCRHHCAYTSYTGHIIAARIRHTYAGYNAYATFVLLSRRQHYFIGYRHGHEFASWRGVIDDYTPLHGHAYFGLFHYATFSIRHCTWMLTREVF